MGHGLHDDGAFADSGCDALFRTPAAIAHPKNASMTGCERSVGSFACSHKSLVVERDRSLQPSRAGMGSDHNEEAMGSDVFRRKAKPLALRSVALTVFWPGHISGWR